MKLIFCTKCKDVVAIRPQNRSCFCGSSWGQYLSSVDAVFGGEAVPLGFANYSFLEALQDQPDESPGTVFTAFVIEKNCPTFRRDAETKK